jgi:hypothetical protein
MIGSAMINLILVVLITDLQARIMEDTMSTSIAKLLSISSEPISGNAPELDNKIEILLDNLGKEFHEILSVKNGFYAFESALHVFPSDNTHQFMDIARWNESSLWRSEYGEIIGEYLFFAEDIFGHQFLVFENKIHAFEPETGEIEEIANDFDTWAKLMLDEYNFRTGFSLAHEWQIKYGAIPQGERLLPKIPFVLGGEYSLDNLYLLDSVKGMRLRATLAHQINNLEDGAKIKWSIS